MFQYGPTPGGQMPGGQIPGQWYVHNQTWWEGAGHLLGLLLFAALIGVAIWAVLRITSDRATIAAATAARVVPPTPVDPALQELRVRYARGDISREDYLERGADLGLAAGPTPETPPQE